MSTLQAGNRGCFVVRFSNDGRFVNGVILHAQHENLSVCVWLLSGRACVGIGA